MNEQNTRKVRWSILFFVFTLMIGSLGLAGCPNEDDDDFFGKVPLETSSQAEAERAK